jgi:predicted Zn-dependent protease
MIALGRTDQAYEVLAQVLSIDKNNLDAKYLTAEAAIKDGSFQIAGAQLADLIRARPDQYRARLMLSEVLVKLDRKPDAIRELETLLKMRPDYPGAAELLTQLGGKVPTTQSTQPTQPAS